MKSPHAIALSALLLLAACSEVENETGKQAASVAPAQAAGDAASEAVAAAREAGEKATEAITKAGEAIVEAGKAVEAVTALPADQPAPVEEKPVADAVAGGQETGPATSEAAAPDKSRDAMDATREAAEKVLELTRKAAQRLSSVASGGIGGGDSGEAQAVDGESAEPPAVASSDAPAEAASDQPAAPDSQ